MPWCITKSTEPYTSQKPVFRMALHTPAPILQGLSANSKAEVTENSLLFEMNIIVMHTPPKWKKLGNTALPCCFLCFDLFLSLSNQNFSSNNLGYRFYFIFFPFSVFCMLRRKHRICLSYSGWTNKGCTGQKHLITKWNLHTEVRESSLPRPHKPQPYELFSSCLYRPNNFPFVSCSIWHVQKHSNALVPSTFCSEWSLLDKHVYYNINP